MKLPGKYFWRAVRDGICICAALVLIFAVGIVILQNQEEIKQWERAYST